MKQKRGFTLIELLIVIVIIGILAVIVVGLVATNARNRATDASAKSEMRELQTALEQYFVDHEQYPAAASVKTDLTGGEYISTTGAVDKLGVTEGYTYTSPDQTCYDLSYTLKNANDTGPGVTDGVYTLTCKQ